MRTANLTHRYNPWAMLFVVMAFATTDAITHSPAHAQKAMDGARAAAVGVDRVRQEITSQTVTVIGRLIAGQAGVVSALVKGAVEKLEVRVGDRVKAGGVIAVLATDSLKWQVELRRAEVMGAKARMASARAKADKRRGELKRLEDLKTSAAFSPARFEDARQEVAIAESTAADAEAQLARARANQALAQIDLANAHIKAPFGGVITSVHTEVGTYLSMGQPVMNILNDSDLEIEADVPANRTAGLKPGTKTGFTLADGSTGKAIVRAVIPDENPLTRTRAVRFVPDGGVITGIFAANQSASVRIPSGPEAEVVTVHKDAVLNKGGRRVVFIIIDDKAEMRPVQLGDGVGQRFVVLQGLVAGDTVVVRGNERLRPGQTVSVKKSAP